MRKYCFKAGTSILALALALSPLQGWALGDGEARAAIQGHKFCETPLAPAELKARMIRALVADSTGNRKLEGCRANPLDFLKAWEEEEGAPKRVADLPDFIGRFHKIVVPVNQEIWAACIREDGNGVKKRCVKRTRESTEETYGIGTHVYLLEGCVNPVNTTVEPVTVAASPCITIFFPGKPFPKEVGGAAIRLGYVGPKDLSAECLLLTRAGVAEPMVGIPNECPPDTYTRKVIGGREVRVVCDWSEVEAEVSRILGVKAEVQNVSGSFYPVLEGQNKLVIHREALNGYTAFCYELPDGTFVTYGVTREHFVDGVATIKSSDVFK